MSAEIQYDESFVYTKGLGYAHERMMVPNVILDTIPSGGSSHVTHGFNTIRTLLDAQGNPVGWGQACLHDGVCENLCKVEYAEDGTLQRFQYECAEHGGDEALRVEEACKQAGVV